MRLIATAAAVAALVTPAAASAASRPPTNSPPGNSGLTQYLEVVPTDSGAKPSKSVRKDRTPLSSRQQQRLQRAGADGKALLGVVAGTSPAPVAAKRPAAKRKAGKRKHAAATTTMPAPTTKPSSAKQRGVLATAFVTGGGGSGDGGLGIPLAIPMLVAAALAGGFALGRRRGGRDDAEPTA
jgi:hypothetical protein